MENLDIRVLITVSGLQYKDVAVQMGISPEYLSRLLKYPLNPRMRERIMVAIRDLKGED